MLSSLRFKIFALFIGGLSLILLVMLIFLSLEMYERYNKLYHQEAETAAEQLALQTGKLFQLGLYPDELLGYEKLCQATLANRQGLAYIALVSEQEVLYEAGDFPDDIPRSLLTSSEEVKNDHLIFRRMNHPSGIDTTIVIAVDHHYETKLVIDLIASITVYGLVITCAGILLVIYFLQKNLVFPITQLVTHIQNTDILHISYSRDQLADRKDEIGVVAKAFNDLINKLAASQSSLWRTNSELQALTSTLEHKVEQRTQELLEANRRLDFIAHTDSLTGLGNRLQFMDIYQQRFKQAQRHQHNFAILMIDLDGFKKVNDEYGHAAGDAILKTIGDRFLNAFRGGDYAFRMGGDEFIFLIEEYKDRDDLIIIVQKLQSHILEPVMYEDTFLPVGLSIGIACLEDSYDIEAHTLLSHSDIAMYKAKKAGGGYTFFADSTE